MDKSEIDHLVMAAPSLKEGQDFIEALLGVRPVYSGEHPQFGTENALLSLGSGVYFEVIALKAGASKEGPLPFGLGGVSKPKLTTWCARPFEMEAACAAAEAAGVEMGGVVAAYRDRPDGARLNWRFTNVSNDRLSGTVPFLIKWDGPHPSDDLPLAGTLESLELAHPDADRLKSIMDGQKLPVSVVAADTPGMSAVIRSTSGELVELS
ncbi:MAG: VOC family protein [Pseudomonadota bacterium]